MVCCFGFAFFQRQVVSFDGKTTLLLFMLIFFLCDPDPGILCDLQLDLSSVSTGFTGVQSLPVFFLLRHPGSRVSGWSVGWKVEDYLYLLIPRFLLNAVEETDPFCRRLGKLLTIPEESDLGRNCCHTHSHTPTQPRATGWPVGTLQLQHFGMTHCEILSLFLACFLVSFRIEISR